MSAHFNEINETPVCRCCGEEAPSCDCDGFSTSALVSREEYIEANWVEMPEFRKPARMERMQGEFDFDAEVA